jgi:hypothetical protein
LFAIIGYFAFADHCSRTAKKALKICLGCEERFRLVNFGRIPGSHGYGWRLTDFHGGANSPSARVIFIYPISIVLLILVLIAIILSTLKGNSSGCRSSH